MDSGRPFQLLSSTQKVKHIWGLNDVLWLSLLLLRGDLQGQKAMQNKRKGEFLDSIFKKYLFVYLALAVLRLHCCIGFSLVATSRGYSLVWASHCSGFSCGSQLWEHRLNSCGTWAEFLQSMWDLPESGIKPMSPAGGFLTTEPLGKPSTSFLYNS